MSVIFVWWRPFSASTRVAAARRSWRVRSRRRSKRLEAVPATAAVDALFITEFWFSYPGPRPTVKGGRRDPPRRWCAWAHSLRRGLERDAAARGRGSLARLRDQHRARPVL